MEMTQGKADMQMFSAIETYDLRKFNEAIAHGANITATNEKGETPKRAADRVLKQAPGLAKDRVDSICSKVKLLTEGGPAAKMYIEYVRTQHGLPAKARVPELIETGSRDVARAARKSRGTETLTKGAAGGKARH